MATGMVSSASTLNSVQPAAGVIRAGEKVATSAAAIKDPKAKTFRHMIPGAKFVMPDGLEVQFLGGSFTTSDPAIIAELSAVANKGTSMIYTQQEAAVAVQAMQTKAAADAADTAGKDGTA